jgi:hypothetical protein
MFAGKAGAIGLGWKGLPGTKHSSLLRKLFLNYYRKSFTTLAQQEMNE